MGKQVWRVVALAAVLSGTGSGCGLLCDRYCDCRDSCAPRPRRIAADPCYDPCAPTGPPPIVRYGDDCQ